MTDNTLKRQISTQKNETIGCYECLRSPRGRFSPSVMWEPALGFHVCGFGAENRFAPTSWPGANQRTSCWWKQLSGSHSIYSSKMHHGGRLIVTTANTLVYRATLWKKRLVRHSNNVVVKSRRMRSQNRNKAPDRPVLALACLYFMAATQCFQALVLIWLWRPDFSLQTWYV